MSFLIDYSRKNDKFELNTVLRERSIPSPIYYRQDNRSIYVGECFDCTAEEILGSNWIDNPTVLNKFTAAGCTISFDESECYFATDNTGRELMFYYANSNRFILSDSFWGIIKNINPVIDDLDEEIVREMIAMGGGVPCDHKTLIKDLYWAEPNMLGYFNARNGHFECGRYAEIQRSGKTVDINEAVEQIDVALKRMANYLSSSFPNAVFGLGLSGGLDSRVALHYIQECGNKVKCFNICTARPRKLFLAKSVKNARLLAKATSADYCEVEWNVDHIRNKFNRMLEYQPLGTGGHFTNAYKYEEEGMPKFDMLITAGQAIGPYLVGVSAEENSDQWNKEDIMKYLMNLETENAPAYRFTTQSIRRILSDSGIGFLDTKMGKGFSCWEKYVDTDTYKRIREKVEGFVDDRIRKGFRPADITLDFRTSTLGAIGRNGAYESALCSYRNFTIYTPFLVKIGLNWDISLVENRRILKELIKKKMPEFSGVGEEEVGALNFKSPIIKLLKRIEFLIRGSGIKADEWYSNNRTLKEELFKDFNNECQWFDSLLKTKSNPDEIWKLSPGRKNSIWELKRLIDCIERQEYKAFKG